MPSPPHATLQALNRATDAFATSPPPSRSGTTPHLRKVIADTALAARAAGELMLIPTRSAPRIGRWWPAQFDAADEPPPSPALPQPSPPPPSARRRQRPRWTTTEITYKIAPHDPAIRTPVRRRLAARQEGAAVSAHAETTSAAGSLCPTPRSARSGAAPLLPRLTPPCARRGRLRRGGEDPHSPPSPHARPPFGVLAATGAAKNATERLGVRARQPPSMCRRLADCRWRTSPRNSPIPPPPRPSHPLQSPRGRRLAYKAARQAERFPATLTAASMAARRTDLEELGSLVAPSRDADARRRLPRRSRCHSWPSPSTPPSPAALASASPDVENVGVPKNNKGDKWREQYRTEENEAERAQ